MARGRALRTGMAYDERTGMKVYGRRLKMDGEKNILTTDPDPVHPQRFVRVPPPDGAGYRPGPGQRDSQGANIDWSYCVASASAFGNQSSFLALRRDPSPRMYTHIPPLEIQTTPAASPYWSASSWGLGGWGLGPMAIVTVVNWG